MKIGKTIRSATFMVIIVVSILFTFTGCRNNNFNSDNGTDSYGSLQPAAEDTKQKIYEWKADVTQNGITDRILINTAPIFAPRKEDINTIEIYSGKTGNLIWSKRVTDIHTDWLNISLYKDNGKDYILIWDPAMWQGKAVYSYRIISFSETGEEIELKTGKIVFDINHPLENDIHNLVNFSNEINQYLNNSFTLVDTTNGKQLYSTPEKKIRAAFAPTEEIEAITSRLNDLKIQQGRES